MLACISSHVESTATYSPAHGAHVDANVEANIDGALPMQHTVEAQPFLSGSEATANMSMDVDHGAAHSFFDASTHKNPTKYNCSGSCPAVVALLTTPQLFAPNTTHQAECFYHSASHTPPSLAGLERPPKISL